YWDISIHIDDGRDPGPLANPAHFFILFGLMGVMAAGIFGMALPQKDIRSSVNVPGIGPHAPAGAIVIAACGALSLTAFPLDDVWHRIFGQDVTLWSPTHLMLITGASLSTFGALALYRESLEESDDTQAVPARAGWLLAPLTGAMLIGLNTFLAEFDFAVPQFRLDMHPVGIALAAGVALVSARLVIGPYGALATVAFFIGLRGFLFVTVGPILGGTEPRFSLYLAEAILVELAAVAFARSGKPIAGRPVTFGLVAGGLIGTLGIAAEWAWSHVWMVHPWTASMFPEAALMALGMALAAGVIGGFVGRALSLRGTRLPAAPGWVLPAAALAAVAIAVLGIRISEGDGSLRAQLQLTPAGEGRVEATVRMQPQDAADDARWLTITSWQGKQASIVQHLERTGPGQYRTVEPVPVDGTWKSILRLHVDDEVLGLPVFLPEDPAIPAKEVPATPTIDRAFVLDKKNLQREQKQGVSGVLTTGAYAGVGLIVIVLFGFLFWGLKRVRETLGHDSEDAAPGPPFADGDGQANGRFSPRESAGVEEAGRLVQGGGGEGRA
ncbi:MAG: hypothetical protein QOD86_1855, partial [Miltoncostaeaceae bacterium]|nr:hypothetical protein [Miltoncostaeaceae bacterium]